MTYSKIICITFFLLIQLPIFSQTTFSDPSMIIDNSFYFQRATNISNADLDGDGDEDVLVSSRNDDENIVWYENNGENKFTKTHILSSLVNLEVKYSSTKDMDNDGDVDIVAFHDNNNQIVWYENDGVGNFGSKQVITNTVDYVFRDICLGDFSGNGKPDVVFANDKRIGIRKNWGNGNFAVTEGTIFTSPSDEMILDIHSEDLDNDGDLDLISTNYNTTQPSSAHYLAWYENDGSGNFSAPIVISIYGVGYGITTGDLNNDGFKDIIISSYDSEKFRSYFSDGMGGFNSNQILDVPHFSNYTGKYSMKALDFDQDGDVDILSNFHGIVYYENNGSGFLSSPQQITNTIEHISSYAPMDMDQDGDWDMLVGSIIQDNNVNWVENIASSDVEIHPIGFSHIPLRAVQCLDFNNDGDMDISVATSKVELYENIANQSFDPQQSFVLNDLDSYYTGHIADFNNDGHLDVLGFHDQPNDIGSGAEIKVGISWNDGNGSYDSFEIITRGYGNPSDLDQDGDMDIITTPQYSGSLYWFVNDGQGNFTYQILNTESNPVGYKYTVDIDNDGDLDILMRSSQGILWLENLGGEIFGNIQTLYSIGQNPAIELEIGDMDSDGDLDILTGYSNKIVWLENDGMENFDTAQIISVVSAGIASVELYDLDQDGDLDVIAASIGADKISWHENDGTGTFGAQIILSQDFEDPVYVTVSDMDGDGDGDIVNVSRWGIIWFENQLPPKEIYVDMAAQGNNDGSSWADAYTDLQDALTLGEYYHIHIAEGTYLPTTNTAKGISFDIPEGTMMLGGYPSGGGIKNPEIYETILSGNIDGLNAVTGNSYHVVTIKDSYNVTLDGLTIRDGNASDASSFARSRGGGIYIKNSTVTLNNVDVKWNRAIYGGGIFATLSPRIAISHSVFKKNRADFGAGLYHSNETMMYIDYSSIVDNIAMDRCAIEINNSSYTSIRNSIIANNASSKANAIGFVATNRDQSANIVNCTILGENKNSNLITYQIGSNNQLEVNLDNSIIAHKNISFSKNMIAYNFGVFNLEHKNCYFQGASTIGNGVNSLYSSVVGNLLLNSDYSVDECSPIVDMGANYLAKGNVDIGGNPRFYNTVDIGAFESQADCIIPRLANENISKDITIFPNPTSRKVTVFTEMEISKITIMDLLGRELISSNEKEIDINFLPKGMYLICIWKNGELEKTERILKEP